MKKRKQPQGKAGRDDGRGPAHPKQLSAPVPCAVHDGPATVKTTVTRHTTRTAVASEGPTARRSSVGRSARAANPEPAAHPSDSQSSNAAYEEYIHNLQQQVYFLELESQMLKHRSSTGGASGGVAGGEGDFDGDSGTFKSFDDIFQQFKRRHSAMEKTYKEQLDANTRTIETLHSQLDAHTALVGQLKREVSRQAELHSVQCTAWSEQHEEALLRLRSAEARITELQGQAERDEATRQQTDAAAAAKQSELEDIILSLRARASKAEETQSVTSQTITSLRASLAASEGRCAATQRQYEDTAAQLDPLTEAAAKASAERDGAVVALKTCELTKRTLEATVAKLEGEAAQLVRAMTEQQGTIERLQSELRRSQYALEAAKMSREDSDAKLTKTQAELLLSRQSQTHAEGQSKLVLERAEALAVELVRSQSAGERLQSTLGTLTRDVDAIKAALVDANDERARATARGEALALDLTHATSRYEAAAVELQKEMQGRSAAEAELAVARRMLEGKPDIEPLESIDFNTLLQSNVEAVSTVDAFLRDAKQREAALQADLERVGGLEGEEENTLEPRFAAPRPTPTLRQAPQSAPSRRPVAPMTESPTRTYVPPAEARSALLGHTRSGTSEQSRTLVFAKRSSSSTPTGWH